MHETNRIGQENVFHQKEGFNERGCVELWSSNVGRPSYPPPSCPLPPMVEVLVQSTSHPAFTLNPPCSGNPNTLGSRMVLGMHLLHFPSSLLSPALSNVHLESRGHKAQQGIVWVSWSPAGGRGQTFHTVSNRRWRGGCGGAHSKRATPGHR